VWLGDGCSLVEHWLFGLLVMPVLVSTPRFWVGMERWSGWRVGWARCWVLRERALLRGRFSFEPGLVIHQTVLPVMGGLVVGWWLVPPVF